MPKLTFTAALLLCCTAAWAQQPTGTVPAAPVSPVPQPRPDQLEPAVDTSATRTDDAAASSRVPDKPTGAATGSTPAAAGDHAASGAPARTAAAKPTGAKGAKDKKAPEHMALDTMEISGNRELPKVLFIVPWKHSDLGDLLGRPPNSLLDEVLQPLDRDVFRRENSYYDALRPDSVPGDSGGQGPAVKP